MLIDTVRITLELGRSLNNQSGAAGFKLQSMARLHDVKSTLTKQKSAYHFVMKQFLRLNRLKWAQLPTELVSESLVQEIRNLVSSDLIIAGLQQIESLNTRLGALREEHQPESGFAQMLQQFSEYFETNAREMLLQCTLLFRETTQKLARFLGCSATAADGEGEDLLYATLQAIVELA